MQDALDSAYEELKIRELAADINWVRLSMDHPKRHIAFGLKLNKYLTPPSILDPGVVRNLRSTHSPL
jgi:hypothetical protein